MPRGAHDNQGLSTTRWPTSRPGTPGPTSATSATTSWPRMVGKVNRFASGLSVLPSPKSMKTCLASEPQIPVIRVLAMTHPGRAGRGSSRSTSFIGVRARPTSRGLESSGADPLLGPYPVEQSFHRPSSSYTVSVSLSQPFGGGSSRQYCSGTLASSRSSSSVVALQRWQLALVELDGGALADHVGLDGHDRGRRPQAALEELGHSPRQDPGDVLVAVVLVAEPRRRVRGLDERRACQQPGVVGDHMIGVGEAHRQEHRRGRRRPIACFEHRGHLRGLRPLFLGEVLVVREVEPDRRGLEERHGGAVLLAPQGDHVVPGEEASARIPRRGLVGVGGRPPAEHGDDGGARVPVDQVGGTEDGVVEVRRHHDDVGPACRGRPAPT